MIPRPRALSFLLLLFIVLSFQTSVEGHITMFSILGTPVTNSTNSTSTDDHAEEGEHGTGSLFGIVGTISYLPGSTSILIVVASILIVEKLFHGLHAITHDTPFQDMVSAIEKELMIVGSMAFVLKIILNTTDFLDINWLHALEYADLLIPIVSFCFCGQGLFLILMSIEQCRLWSKAYHLYVEEIMDEYYDVIKLPRIFQIFRMFQIRAEMEFRVFYEIFCDHYKIRRGSFAFDVYVEMVFEKFLLDIITIRPIDWILVCSLTLLNWLRGHLTLDWGFHYCKNIHDHEEHAKCTEFYSLYLFTLLGWLIVAVSILLAIVSRYYERCLLDTRGVLNIEDYIVFLKYAEEKPRESVLTHYLAADELKNALGRLKIQDAQEKDKRRRRSNFLTAIQDDWNQWLKSWSKPHVGLTTRVLPFSNDSGKDETIGDGVSAKAKPMAPSISMKVPPKKHMARDSRFFSIRGHLKSKFVSNAAQSFMKLMKIRIQIGEDINNIYFFESPSVYFEIVMGLIMIISFYMALWITNFNAVSYHQKEWGTWLALSGLPCLVGAGLNLYIIKCAALLKAVTQLDRDAVAEVMEQTEASKALGEMVRNKILSRLSGMGNPEEEIRNLFNQIDENCSNTLSRKEFQIFLHDLEITFSRKRWDQIYKEIDRNFDDEISLDELFLFIFPEHDVALRQEKQRLKIVRDRVRRNTVSMAQINPSVFRHTQKLQDKKNTRRMSRPTAQIIGRNISVESVSEMAKEESGGLYKFRSDSDAKSTSEHLDRLSALETGVISPRLKQLVGLSEENSMRTNSDKNETGAVGSKTAESSGGSKRYRPMQTVDSSCDDVFPLRQDSIAEAVNPTIDHGHPIQLPPMNTPRHQPHEAVLHSSDANDLIVEQLGVSVKSVESSLTQ